MQTLKIGFTDYFKPIDEFFISILSKRYMVIRDDTNPDYLFFCDETFGKNNLNFDPTKTKKVFFTGENRRPWSYTAHHAISFDHLDSPQFYRLPLYAVEEWIQTKKFSMPTLTERQSIVPEKTGFCGFVASNGGCKERNDIFHLLSSYKQVDSGGSLFNNIGTPLPRGDDAHLIKMNFFASRKFSLCYENSSYPGYTTEKLYYGLYARTVPIYWGSPVVEVDFNPAAFVSRHNFRNDKEMMDYIIHLDNDDEAYYNMLNQPALLNNRWFNINNFLNWFDDHVYMRKS